MTNAKSGHKKTDIMNRRDFMKTMAVAGGMALFGDWQQAFAAGKKDKWTGKPWKGWKSGEFQAHFIYTGVAESIFIILPDGTTMLLDCGDHNAIGRGPLAVPVLPNPNKHAGEWIARYVQRVNPQVKDVDYIMLSHYHDDHGGTTAFYTERLLRNHSEYFLSGFAQAAEFLTFHKAFDRCWPELNDPLPIHPKQDHCIDQMSRFYKYMSAERGLEIEKFQLGATNQIAMLRSPQKYPDFNIRNITANGRIAGTDGTVTDLYKDFIATYNPKRLNENGMSLGMIFQYGPFRLYTAGDFSDGLRRSDGTKFQIEDELGKVVPICQVAKVNHHGHHSMYPGLVRGLQSRVYISCVWDQLHNLDDTMSRLCDRSLYPGERIVCPGIMPKERRAEDADKFWMKDLPEAAFEGGHIVLNVDKGGKTYSVSYLTAEDESMNVRSVLRFKS